MALIQKRVPHSRKPEGPVEIDWGNSLTEGLIGAWFFNEGAGNTTKDLTLRQDGTLAGGSVWSVGERSRVIDFSSASTARVELGDLDIYSRMVSGRELAIFGIGTLETNLNQHLFSKESEYALRFVQGVSTPYMRMDLYGGNSGTAAELALGQRFAFGVDWLSGTGGTLFVDGDVYKTSTNTDTSVNGNFDLNIGVRFSSVSLSFEEAFTGAIEVVLFYDRQIGQVNHKKLSENPYQILKPRRRWVPFSGAAGTTFNQAVSGSITSTGALTFITSFVQTLTGSISSTGILARKISTSVEGSITATGSVLKNTIRVLAGSITSTGALASELSSDILKTVTGSITATGTLTKKVFRSLSGSISSTGATTKKTSIDLDGSISMSGDPDKGMSQDTSGSITPTGDLTASAPFVPAPDEGGGPGPDGSLAQRIRRVYGYFKRDGR